MDRSTRVDPLSAVEADWRRQTTDLCTLAVDMLRHARQAFVSHRLDGLDTAERLGRRLHDGERSLTERIVHPYPTARLVLKGDQQRLFAPVHLERACDRIEMLLQSIRAVVHDGIPFTDRARREVQELIDTAIELLLDLRDLLLTHNKALRRHVIESGQAFVARADDCAAFHERRLIEGVCAPRASSLYLAIVSALKGIEWHTREIAQKLEHLTSSDVRDLNLTLEGSPPVAVRTSASGQKALEAADDRSKPSPIGWVP